MGTEQKFCKIFETEEYGQIVALRESGNEGPEMRIYFRPSGLGTCHARFGFTDDEAGEDKADAALANLTEEAATSVVSELFNHFSPAEREQPHGK